MREVEPPQADRHDVRVWFVVVRDLPLLVVDVGVGTAGPALQATLAQVGLEPVPQVYGHLPRRQPPRVGFTLTASELRLDDDAGRALLRVARAEVDSAWCRAALRMRGTMVYATGDLPVDAGAADRAVCDALDAAARAGSVLGAIVGVAESRPSLPVIG